MIELTPLYARQQLVTSLRNINSIKEVFIIGCGGIGSHVALRLAMLGVKNFTLLDSDDVEFHNLSRTFFEDHHVGITKVSALKEMLEAKRTFNSYDLAKKIIVESYSTHGEDIFKLLEETETLDASGILAVEEALSDANIQSVLTYNEKLSTHILEFLGRMEAKNIHRDECLIIDCTDNYFNPDNYKNCKLEEIDWKLNYDNLDITITANPYQRDEHGKFKLDIEMLSEGNGGYTQTPSFFATPDMVTTLWISYLTMFDHRIEESRQWHINLAELINHCFSNEYLIDFEKTRLEDL